METGRALLKHRPKSNASPKLRVGPWRLNVLYSAQPKRRPTSNASLQTKVQALSWLCSCPTTSLQVAALNVKCKPLASCALVQPQLDVLINQQHSLLSKVLQAAALTTNHGSSSAHCSILAHAAKSLLYMTKGQQNSADSLTRDRLRQTRQSTIAPPVARQTRDPLLIKDVVLGQLKRRFLNADNVIKKLHFDHF